MEVEVASSAQLSTRGEKMRVAGRGKGRLRAAERRARTLVRLRRSAPVPGCSGFRSARPCSVSPTRCRGPRLGTTTRGDTRQKVAHSWGRKVSGSGVFGAGADGGLRPGLPSPFLGLGLELPRGGGERGRRLPLQRAPAAGHQSHVWGTLCRPELPCLETRTQAAGSVRTSQPLKG